MKAKLFVTDMDGTLLNSEHKISRGNKHAIKRAVEAGVVFTIATGRMYASTLPYAQELELDVPIITYNGALIKTASGKELYASYLEEDLVKDLLDFAREQELYIHLYSEDKLYFKENDEHAQYYQKMCGVPGNAVGEDIYKYTYHVPKMLIMGSTPEEADAAVELVRRKFGGRIDAMKSSATYEELIKPGLYKATAIAKLAEILEIPSEQVLAIGDSSNDVSMLTSVAISVAMGNANDEARAAARYMVTDNEHDGVAEALERFCM